MWRFLLFAYTNLKLKFHQESVTNNFAGKILGFETGRQKFNDKVKLISPQLKR